MAEQSLGYLLHEYCMNSIREELRKTMKEGRFAVKKKTNAEWCIENGIKFKDLTVVKAKGKPYTIKNCETGKIIDAIKTSGDPYGFEVFRWWLDQEHVEPILDGVEKRYLKQALRPYMAKVLTITKNAENGWNGEKLEHISVVIEGQSRLFIFPNFKEGVMCKGMKVGKRYKPEELGL